MLPIGNLPHKEAELNLQLALSWIDARGASFVRRDCHLKFITRFVLFRPLQQSTSEIGNGVTAVTGSQFCNYCDILEEFFST